MKFAIHHIDGDPNNLDLDNLTITKMRSDMNTIPQLQWTKIGGYWKATVNENSSLRIYPGEKKCFELWSWLPCTSPLSHELLNRFPSLDEAKNAAAEWVGDSE